MFLRRQSQSNQAKRALMIAVAVASVLPGVFNEARAVKTDKVKVDTSDIKSTSSLPHFGTVATGRGQVFILAENAKVKISSSKNVTDVALASNAPRNWNVKGSMVRQCGFSAERKGTSMMADQFGSRAIVNGKVYELPQGQLRGLQMNQEGLFINGQKQEPLKGSDIPGTGGNEDLLEISVPASFSGALRIGAAANSEISIDDLSGGSLELYLMGNSNLSAGTLDKMDKLVVDNKSKGKAEFGKATTKIFVANVAGTGSVIVQNGKAEVSNATVSGTGLIKLNGKFDKLQQSADGTGKIEVTP